LILTLAACVTVTDEYVDFDVAIGPLMDEYGPPDIVSAGVFRDETVVVCIWLDYYFGIFVSLDKKIVGVFGQNPFDRNEKMKKVITNG